MSLASVFNIAGSGMSAQNTRLNTVASNIANAETVSSSIDQTYRARHPVFATTFQQAQNGSQSLFQDQDAAGQGVQIGSQQLIGAAQHQFRLQQVDARCIGIEQTQIDAHNAEHCGPLWDAATDQTQQLRTTGQADRKSVV